MNTLSGDAYRDWARTHRMNTSMRALIPVRPLSHDCAREALYNGSATQQVHHVVGRHSHSHLGHLYMHHCLSISPSIFTWLLVRCISISIFKNSHPCPCARPQETKEEINNQVYITRMLRAALYRATCWTFFSGSMHWYPRRKLLGMKTICF